MDETAHKIKEMRKGTRKGMDEKAGILTFHGAHNYGSCLQAYALLNAIRNMGYDSEIINFRTKSQKDQYAPLTKRKGFKYVLKNGYFLLNLKKRKEKYRLFELFINKYLVGGKEYATEKELSQITNRYKYFICGSDQIWNIRPNDHSDAYFLPFAKGKKIAYAPSFGGMDSVDNDSKIKDYLMDFDALSVREESGKKIILDLLGKEVPVLPDPTLLLKKDDWEAITPERKIKYDYILFYTLYSTPRTINAVKKISKELKLPVIITTITNQYDIFSGFVKEMETGPLEFLSLIKHARYICVCSFHGTVFSILMHKQFTVIDGMSDLRISTLLRKLHLTKHSWNTNEPLDIKKCLEEIDYDIVDAYIDDYRTSGLQYLEKALDL